MRKNIIWAFILLSMITISFFLIAEAEAESFSELRNRFPAGYYWVGGDPNSASATYTGNGNSYSWNTILLNGSSFSSSGTQCYGFANVIMKYLHGEAPKGPSDSAPITETKNYIWFNDINQAVSGDYIRFSGHSAVVISVDNSYIYVVDCNYINPSGTSNCITWDHRFSKSSISLTNGWHYKGSSATTPPPTDTPSPTGSIQVEYFSGDNSSFSGSVLYTEYVNSINKNWGTSRPSSSVPNVFSARFTQQITLSGWYKFSYEVEDCIKIWINNDCIVDNWGSGGSGSETRNYSGTYTMKVEYASHGGDAKIIVGVSQTSAPTPAPTTEPTTPPAQTGSIQVNYFSGDTLSGSSVYSETVNNINKNWGTSRPSSSVPNVFSARFTQQVTLSGWYKFSYEVKDCIKIWINNDCIIDNWGSGGSGSETRNYNGTYTMKVEYASHGGDAKIIVGVNSTSAPAPTLPDLMPTQISCNCPTLFEGGRATFTVGVSNGSSIAANSFNVSWYVNGEWMDSSNHTGIQGNQTLQDDYFIWDPNAKGTYIITFKVDSENSISESNENNNSISMTVQVEPALSLTSVTPDNTSPRIGDAVTWTAVATGGIGTKLYSFDLYGNGFLIDSTGWSTSASYQYTPTDTWAYWVIAYVTDGTEVVLDFCSDEIIAAEPLTITSVNPNSTFSLVGSTITWTATATGGSGGTKNYRFFLYKDGVILTSSIWTTSASYRYTPTETGTYKVRTYVKDSVDIITKDSANVIVRIPIAIKSVTADKTSVYTGTAITWTAVASGGGGTKTYRFFLYKDGVELASSRWTTSAFYTYTPTNAGTYKVRVYAQDKSGIASMNSANIVVSLPLSITAVTSNSTFSIVGSTIRWTATATNGNGIKTYRFFLYKDGVQLASSSWSASASYQYTPTETGTYKVRAYVKDNINILNQYSADVPVRVPIAIKSVTADRISANTGTAITWTAIASGGGGTKTYRFFLYKDGVELTSSRWTTSASYTYTPSNAGTYRIRVYAQDKSGVASKTSADIIVKVPFSITNVTPSTTFSLVGSKITWIATATGGNGTKTYCFFLYKDSVQIASSSWSASTSYQYTPTETGTYKVRAYVKDSIDILNKYSADVIVRVPIAIKSVIADRTSANTGTAITWTAVATGGGGTKTYRFFLYKDGVEQTSSKWTTSASYTYTPTVAGNYKVKVYVQDKSGIASKTGTNIIIK